VPLIPLESRAYTNGQLILIINDKWHYSLLIVKGVNYNLLLKYQFQDIIMGAILYEKLHRRYCLTPLNHNAKIEAFHVSQIYTILKCIIIFGGAVNHNSIFSECFYYYFIPTTCFGPYGPSSDGIYTSQFPRANRIHCIHTDSGKIIAKTKTNIYTVDNLKRITDPL
jgi:hypothetical protein